MKITFIKTGKRLKPKNNLIDTIKEKNKKINFIKKSKKGNSIKNIINQNERKEDKITIKDIFNTIFKKNQIVILTLALMLVTAGYMNYNNSNQNEIKIAELGDAKLVSAELTEENISEDEEIYNQNNENEENDKGSKENEKSSQNSKSDENGEISKESENTVNIIETSISNQNYFAQTRIERETMYSQMIETYQKIIEKNDISSEQKSTAVNEIKNINDRKNAISIIENLIKTKGFSEVVILINDNNINVVVQSKDNLTDEQVAQITNIVSRELKAEIQDIHISIHK